MGMSSAVNHLPLRKAKLCFPICLTAQGRQNLVNLPTLGIRYLGTLDCKWSSEGMALKQVLERKKPAAVPLRRQQQIGSLMCIVGHQTRDPYE
jgi:hypothetical protein